jgi:hypothetical protein
VESDTDFVVILSRRDGSRRFMTDDPLTVGVVRDLIRTGTAEVRSGRQDIDDVPALAVGGAG